MADALTARATVIADRMVELFTQLIQNESFASPPIQAVHYGDQLKIPVVPAICVEPGTKVRQWPPTPTDMTQNTIEVGIYVYYMNSELGVSGTRRATDRLAEDLEFYLNGHRQLTNAVGDRLVIYSYVYSVDPGYARKDQKLFNASLLSWRGLTKTRLTDPA